MAARGFSCPNCRTWFEGHGNHPKCPICGTRAGSRDLLDEREQPSAPDYETSPEAPRGYGEAGSSGGSQPAPRSDSGSGGEGRIGQVIGIAVFIALIASQVCRALRDSG